MGQIERTKEQEEKIGESFKLINTNAPLHLDSNQIDVDDIFSLLNQYDCLSVTHESIIAWEDHLERKTR